MIFERLSIDGFRKALNEIYNNLVKNLFNQIFYMLNKKKHIQ